MSSRKTVLLKITGEIFCAPDLGCPSSNKINTIARQIKTLSHLYDFGIVIGGGNFFRGNIQGKSLGLSSSVGHQIGMLATMMNGLIVKDLFEQHDIRSTIFCAIPTSEVGIPISNQAIRAAQQRGECLIFTGGTGNPFFTTDTTAVLRALQMNAAEVWKGTTVDGIYCTDPKKNPQANIIKDITFKEALLNNLKIMDATAFTLAQEYNLPIRIFNIFKEDALIKAASDASFGSIMHS